MTVLVPERPNRRDFLSWTSYSLLGIGAVAAAWPFVDSMNPTGEAIEKTKVWLDLSGLGEGKALETSWRGWQILVLRRTAAQLARLETSNPPPAYRLANINGTKPLPSPAYTNNWHRSIDPAIFVVVAHCTFEGQLLQIEYRSWWTYAHGETPERIFHCPDCGSDFDLAGRRLIGPGMDLFIPSYRFYPDRNHYLIVGEDPPKYSGPA